MQTRPQAGISVQAMRFALHDRSTTVTRLRRTFQSLVAAGALLALTAPMAQAKPLQMPSGPASPGTPAHRAAAVAGTSTGIGWVGVAVGVAMIVVLVGLAFAGGRLANRRAVEA